MCSDPTHDHSDPVAVSPPVGTPDVRHPRFDPAERALRFPILRRLREKVLVFDGAMGTMIQNANLTVDDFHGNDGCNEILVASRPDVIRSIHAAYFEAGADVVETDTFGSTRIVLAEYGLEDQAYDLNRKAAALAREAADSFERRGHPRFVAGSMGPTTRLVTLGHVTFEDLHDSYLDQARGLIDGGCDALQIETCQDLQQIKCAVIASRAAMAKCGREVPIFVTVTIETTGTMLLGSEIGAALTTIENLPVDAIGMNCATGPDLMQENVRFLGANSTRLVAILPNAGLPRNVGGKAVYDLTPGELAKFQERFVRDFRVSMVGGCCGTRPEHIKALAERVGQLIPAERPASFVPSIASLYAAMTLDQDSGPLLIGERTNANGSKLFKEHLVADNWDGMVELAKEQVKEGAHALDVCTAFVGRNEKRDMEEVLRRFSTQVTIPLMIDTTQLDVLEAALKIVPGRAIINSINLEDGEGKADRLCELARTYGAALVALTIDETGMAKTAQRKLEVAQRLYDIVTGRHGLRPDCLLFDVLTFTIGSGDEDSRRAAIETLEGITLIKKHLPGTRTILGLSNISFGLKPFPRQILNSVFMEEARRHGLDSAIVHASKIIPTHKLSEDDLKVTRDLIHDRRSTGYDPLFAFIERFAGAKRQTSDTEVKEEDLPIEEVLKKRIIDGNKIGIDKQLDRAMQKYKPLDIINQVLLDGMKVVGELFGSGQMQLPFVLQSAETMKVAVAYLEPHMDKVEGGQKGTLVLATVRGDVHDIGKNLVDIIVSNNGYRVINLGIKQPIEAILGAADKAKADAVGMSGLLVKSTVVMKENLELMSTRGLKVPVICGGAALNRAYVEQDLRGAYTTGPVYYGQDAFTGLHLMDEICGQTKTKTFTAPTPVRRGVRRETPAERDRRLQHAFQEYAESNVPAAQRIPEPPFWGSQVVDTGELDLMTLLRYVNKKALYGLQWQYRKRHTTTEEYVQFLQGTVEPKFKHWCHRAVEEKLLEPRVIYGYFPCAAEKNDLLVFDHKSGKELVRFTFPRQPRHRRLCISDFFRRSGSGERDVVAFTLVTMGAVAARTNERLFAENKYDDYLHFHGLSVEATEALAEYWHKRIRQQLSIAENDAPEIDGMFQQKYHGGRYSFGYPACPDLEDQKKLWPLLDPSRIGVSLSEEFQLVPEQSTSALVCHHPQAKYFNVTV